MRVRRVEILRSPGLESGFTVDGFAGGLTIIEGRNESGKSTLAGAIRALLWPERSATLRARGEFAIDEKVYRAFVDTHGGGWEGDAPAMPDSSAGRGMIVGISDLWQDDEHDRAIREAMVRELQGGYDLGPLHDGAQGRSPTAPMRDAREAERTLADARNVARSLMAQEATLPRLREQAEQCRNTANQRPLVERALERLDLIDRLSAARHELAALPAGALRVDGKEADRLRSLRGAIEEAEQERESEAAAALAAEAGLAAIGLPVDGVPAGDLRVLADLSSEVHAVERQLADGLRHVAEREAQADATQGGLAALDAEGLTRLEAALTAAHEARERRARAMAVVEEPAPAGVRGSRAPLVVVVVVALVAAVAAAVALAWVAMGLALATAGIALFVALRGERFPKEAAADPRARAEACDAEYQKALAAVREIAGADESLTSTLAISVAADRAVRHAAAVAAVLAARAGVESLRAERDALIGRSASVLGQYSNAPCASGDDLARLLADLEHRAREHARLSREASDAGQRASRCHERAARARRDYSSLLAGLDLTEDRLGELAEWLRFREPAQRLAEKVRQGEAQLQSLDASLGTAPDVLNLDRAGLESRLRACEEAQERAGAVHKEIGNIEGAVERARGIADVGRAIAGFERAAQAVADARDHECAKAARRLILAHAVTGMEREDRPALVRQADALLSRFTANAYGLRIGARSEPEVYDQRSGSAKLYAQLSSGTRAQALLAMRLASAFEAERVAEATPLPLVLDEPLATTDDQRFEAVASATFGLAREGRQLVYLTCEPAHARRLERLAGEHAVECVRLDLDAIRGREALDRNPAAALVEPLPAPTPSKLGREDYLRWRGVRPLDPWASTDAIDLFHLLPGDLDTLHALTVRGVTTVGQVCAQAEREGPGFGWPDVARRCACVRRLVEAWRVGRARAVTPEDLVQSGAVSDRYLERVVQVNASVGGSAPALLEALDSGQVKGFRSNKTDQLRDYLGSIGLLPAENPAPRESLLQTALGDEGAGASDLLEAAGRVLDLLEAAIDDRDEAHAPAGV